MRKNNMGKKTTRKDLQEDIRELREEEELPLFSEAQIKTFNSGYIQGYDEALALLDEKGEVHHKTRKGKEQSF